MHDDLPHTTTAAPTEKSLSIEDQAQLWLSGYMAGYTQSKVGMVPPEISVHPLYQHGYPCGTLFRLGEIYENQAKRAARVLVKKKFGLDVTL